MRGKMDEGYIWVWSTIQTNRKENASIRENFKQQVTLSLCDCGNVIQYKQKNGDGPHGTHLLLVQQTELSGVH